MQLHVRSEECLEKADNEDRCVVTLFVRRTTGRAVSRNSSRMRFKIHLMDRLTLPSKNGGWLDDDRWLLWAHASPHSHSACRMQNQHLPWASSGTFWTVRQGWQCVSKWTDAMKGLMLNPYKWATDLLVVILLHGKSGTLAHAWPFHSFLPWWKLHRQSDTVRLYSVTKHVHRWITVALTCSLLQKFSQWISRRGELQRLFIWVCGWRIGMELSENDLAAP